MAVADLHYSFYYYYINGNFKENASSDADYEQAMSGYSEYTGTITSRRQCFSYWPKGISTVYLWRICERKDWESKRERGIINGGKGRNKK